MDEEVLEGMEPWVLRQLLSISGLAPEKGGDAVPDHQLASVLHERLQAGGPPRPAQTSGVHSGVATAQRLPPSPASISEPAGPNALLAPAPPPPTAGELGFTRQAPSLVEIPFSTRQALPAVAERQDGGKLLNMLASSSIETAIQREALAFFARTDCNGDGKLTRAELIKALRTDFELSGVLNLPAHIREGQRQAFERVFQAMDADDNSGIPKDEFVTFVLGSMACSLGGAVGRKGKGGGGSGSGSGRAAQPLLQGGEQQPAPPPPLAHSVPRPVTEADTGTITLTGPGTLTARVILGCVSTPSFDFGRGQLGLPDIPDLHRQHVRVGYHLQGQGGCWGVQKLGKNPAYVMRGGAHHKVALQPRWTWLEDLDTIFLSFRGDRNYSVAVTIARREPSAPIDVSGAVGADAAHDYAVSLSTAFDFGIHLIPLVLANEHGESMSGEGDYQPIVVEAVDAGSSAAAAGVRPNDELLAVNGVDVRGRGQRGLEDAIQAITTTASQQCGSSSSAGSGSAGALPSVTQFEFRTFEPTADIATELQQSSDEQRHTAVVRLQAHFRGWAARMTYMENLEQLESQVLLEIAQMEQAMMPGRNAATGEGKEDEMKREEEGAHKEGGEAAAAVADQKPVPETTTNELPVVVASLTSPDMGWRYDLLADSTTVLGRPTKASASLVSSPPSVASSSSPVRTNADCGLPSVDKSISRRHAQISTTCRLPGDHLCHFICLGENEVMVNGVKVDRESPVDLNSGDRIVFGSGAPLVIMFEQPSRSITAGDSEATTAGQPYSGTMHRVDGWLNEQAGSAAPRVACK